MKNSLFLPLLFVFLCSEIGLLSQRYSFRGYGVEQGLPQSEVFCITDDHLGYLWVGTNGGGLCRFDGRSFKVLNKKDGLPDNVVFSLCQDSHKNMWAATPKGIVRYDGRDITVVLNSDTTIFTSASKLIETGDGKMWFSARMIDGRNELFRIDNDSLINARQIYPDLLDKCTIYYAGRWPKKQIAVAGSHGMIVIGANGIAPLDIDSALMARHKNVVLPLWTDRQKQTWLLIPRRTDGSCIVALQDDGTIRDVELPNDFPPSSLSEVYEDRDGVVWIGSIGKGLVSVNDGKSTFYQVANGLLSNFILSIFQDREGNMWFGTSGEGLIRYSGGFMTALSDAHGLIDNMIISIHETPQGVKYISDGSGGINILDDGRLSAFMPRDGVEPGIVHAFSGLPSGETLVGSEKGLWSFDGKQLTYVGKRYGMKYPAPVSSIVVDGDTTYIGSFFYGLFKSAGGRLVEHYTVENSQLISNRIISLFQDGDGRLWIGTEKGLSVLSGGQFINYNEQNGLPSSMVFQFARDKTGNIWMANFTGGLVRFDGEEFFSYNSLNGLKSDIVYSVVSDKQGNIWAGGQIGVDQVVIDRDGGVVQINHYDKYDGFLGRENNKGAALCDRNGVLWFGTIKGVMMCDINQLKTNYLPPSVFVSSVSVNSSRTNWREKPYAEFYDSLQSWNPIPMGLNLPAKFSHVNFSFDALCQSIPEKVLYRWKLEPADADFCEPTTNNTASYTLLPPGEYTLRVIACNNDGIWNEEGDSFQFKVSAPWWATPLVRVLLWVFAALMAFLVLRTRHRAILRHNRELGDVFNSGRQEVNQFKQKVAQLNGEIQKLVQNQEALHTRLDISEQHLVDLMVFDTLISDKVTVQRLAGFIHSMFESELKPHFFGFALHDPEAHLLVFQYSILNGDVQPLFHYPDNEYGYLSVSCLNSDSCIMSDNWEKEKPDSLADSGFPYPGFRPVSVLAVPFTLRSGVRGVVSFQDERIGLFDGYHLQLVKLIAQFMKYY